MHNDHHCGCGGEQLERRVHRLAGQGGTQHQGFKNQDKGAQAAAKVHRQIGLLRNLPGHQARPGQGH